MKPIKFISILFFITSCKEKTSKQNPALALLHSFEYHETKKTGHTQKDTTYFKQLLELTKSSNSNRKEIEEAKKIFRKPKYLK